MVQLDVAVERNRTKTIVMRESFGGPGLNAEDLEDEDEEDELLNLSFGSALNDKK